MLGALTDENSSKTSSRLRGRVQMSIADGEKRKRVGKKREVNGEEHSGVRGSRFACALCFCDYVNELKFMEERATMSPTTCRGTTRQADFDHVDAPVCVRA